jgi:mono/diheme cytochrome c family protein
MSPAGALLKPPASIAAMLLAAAAIGGCGTGAAGVSGAAVFTAHCAICHSISGAPAPELQGGDLGHQHLPRDELVQFTTEMPVEKRPLTRPELRAVVGYLFRAESR